MDYHALAQTPLFTGALVLCAVVGAYIISVVVKAALSRVSAAAVSLGIIQHELPTISLAKRFQEQLNTLLERVSRIERLSIYLPAPFQDSGWDTLRSTCDVLKYHRSELVRLINQRDFQNAFRLASFLAGKTVTPPDLQVPLDAREAQLMIHWHTNTTLLLERMVAKLEDAARSHESARKKPLAEDFFVSLERIRQSIIEDEERYT